MRKSCRCPLSRIAGWAFAYGTSVPPLAETSWVPREEDPAGFLKRDGQGSVRLFFPRPQETLGMQGGISTRLLLNSCLPRRGWQ